MKRLQITSLLLALTGILAACGGGGGSLSSDATLSSFGTVVGGQIDATLTDEENNSVSDPDVGLVAYVTGLDVDEGTAVARSGIAAGRTVGAPVTTGTATYNGTYAVGIIDRVNRTSTSIFGLQGQSAGNVALNADFDAATLTGTGASVVGVTTDIIVDGTISGQALTGNVTLNHDLGGTAVPSTLNTSLTGSIGATGVIGAFQGNDFNTVAAGGFVAE
ncbi:MAG: hypothetical protein AAF718_00230 [Pseudomonadota bacterium]